MASVYDLVPKKLFEVPRSDTTTVCNMCHLPAIPMPDRPNIDAGPLYQYAHSDDESVGIEGCTVYCTHYLCMLASPGVRVLGEDHEGIKGILPNEMMKEWRRGGRLKCIFCGLKHATIGCSFSKCRNTFHLPCGIANGCNFQFHGGYTSSCHLHSEGQKIYDNLTEELLNKDRSCGVCLEELQPLREEPVEDRAKHLHGPCCGGWAEPQQLSNLGLYIEEDLIPLYHADPTQDSFQAKFWIERLERLKGFYQWTDAQTLSLAINALRGDALHFLVYLNSSFQGQGATTTNWTLFKKQFLMSFGKQDTDINLAVVQKKSETVHKFAHRVVVTTDEFFDTINLPETPNFNAVAHNAKWAELVQDQVVQEVITFFVSETVRSIKMALNKNIYLNGLNAQINALVKDSNPQTFLEAVDTAKKFQSNLRGPINDTIPHKKPSAKMLAQTVNRIKSNQTQGWRCAPLTNQWPDQTAQKSYKAANWTYNEDSDDYDDDF